jgi:hypothetical protein
MAKLSLTAKKQKPVAGKAAAGTKVIEELGRLVAQRPGAPAAKEDSVARQTASATGISAGAVVRPVGATGLEETRASRLGRSAVAKWSLPATYRQLEKQAKQEIIATERAPGGAQHKNPSFVPDNTDIRERAYRLAKREIDSYPEDERNLATRFLLSRFPETARTKLGVAEQGTSAPEGGNVAPKFEPTKARKGLTAITEKQNEILGAAAKARAERPNRIANLGLDATIKESQKQMAIAEAEGDRGLYETHLRDFEAASAAKSILQKKHSSFDPTKHGSQTNQESREEGGRKSRFGGSKKEDGDRESFEGKIDQPGALAREPSQILKDAYEIIAADEAMLAKYLRRFNAADKKAIQKRLEKFELDPTSSIHSMERGDILRAASKGIFVEAQVKSSGPSQQSKRAQGGTFESGGFDPRAVEPEESPKERDPMDRLKAEPALDEISGIRSPADRLRMVGLLKKIAEGHRGGRQVKVQPHERGKFAQQQRSIVADMDRLTDFGINRTDARKILQDPKEALRVMQALMAGEAELTRPRRSPEEQEKRRVGSGSSMEAIIGELRPTSVPNPSTQAMKRGEPGVPVPIGLEAKNEFKKTPGQTIKDLSELPVAADRGKRYRPKEAPVKPSGNTDIKELLSEVNERYMKEVVNLNGKLATRREHIRMGHISPLDVRKEQGRMAEKDIKEFTKAYKLETKKLAKQKTIGSSRDSELNSSRLLDMAYEDKKNLEAQIKSGKAKPVRRSKTVTGKLLEAGREDSEGKLLPGGANLYGELPEFSYNVMPKELLREINNRIKMLERQTDPHMYRVYKKTKDSKGTPAAVDAIARLVSAKVQNPPNAPYRRRIERKSEEGRPAAQSTPPIPAMFVPQPGAPKPQVMYTGGMLRDKPQSPGRAVTEVTRRVENNKKKRKKDKTARQQRESDISVVRQSGSVPVHSVKEEYGLSRLIAGLPR